MSILGIDIGQSSAKGCAFNADGRLLAYETTGYKMLYPRPGYSEIDGIGLSSKIKDLLRKINQRVKKDPVEAISVSTFGESFVPVNKEGNIISNIICPNDIRGNWN